MPKEKDDSFFVQKSLQGDKDAFGELVRRYQRTVTRTARLWTKSEEDAADIAQETFFRAYRYLNGFKLEKRFINWLLGITTNTIFRFKYTYFFGISQAFQRLFSGS